MASALRDSQMAMARYLRKPQREPPPAGVEQRRLDIYSELVYNNIEGFISGGFPILRSLYEDLDWHHLVRQFIEQHRCHTPYFLEISQEFLQYLANVHQSRPCDPAFIAELAHYEWVELALDVAAEELPVEVATQNLLEYVPTLSPLVRLLNYQFPVHKIGPQFRPEQPGQPVFLLVYRNRKDRVKFIELNAATARLLELVRDNSGSTMAGILRDLAAEMGVAVDSIVAFGLEQIDEFCTLGVVVALPDSA